MTALQVGIALMALVSLQPYVLWSHQKSLYVVATIIVIASCAGCFGMLSFTRARTFLSLAFSLFLIYLSALPKVEGGTTRWFFLIPFCAALLHLRNEDLRAAFAKFHWLFALSLVPGMALWLWIVVGLPIELSYTTPPGDIIQRGVTEYAEKPGAIFLLSNGIVLPHGGVLFRLCGMYDEPGTVGTIAALCLGVTRFRLSNIKGALSFLAGVMSFSIAFAVLTAVGLAATAISAKRPRLLSAAVLSVVVGLIPLMGLKFDGAKVSNVTLVMSSPAQAQSAPWLHLAPSAPFITGTRERFAPAPEWGLRNSAEFDNRALPRMRKLFDDYRSSPMSSLLFGIASDASIVRGWGSSVWYRVLTDFGIIGFVWVFVLFFAPLVYLWRRGRLDVAVMIFCVLFLMSFYQRPIIWLPAQLLIYFAGLFAMTKPTTAAAQA
jgi:hypothetical protein